MIIDKIKNFSLENYINNDISLENFFELLKDNDLPEEVYTQLLCMMRQISVLAHSVMFLTDLATKRGILDISAGKMSVEGKDLSQEDEYFMTEAACFIVSFSKYMDQLHDQENVLLTTLLLNEMFGNGNEINPESEDMIDEDENEKYEVQ